MQADVIQRRVKQTGRFLALLAVLQFVEASGPVSTWGQSGSQAGAQSNSQEKPDGQPPAASADKPDKKDQPPADPGMTRIRIRVTGDDKPVAEASVYVRFPQAGGLFHKDKLAELSFKTNQDGSVKVPEVPRGKIQIQVVAKGWHYFGKWYDMDRDEETVLIKLEPPPHWY